jgi:hypothetical protein
MSGTGPIPRTPASAGERIADARRACLNVDGRPKKAYASIGEASDFIVQHGMKNKHAYACPYGCGFHIGARERRMIFPTADKPCGTPGCERTDAHMPARCGPPSAASLDEA